MITNVQGVSLIGKLLTQHATGLLITPVCRWVISHVVSGRSMWDDDVQGHDHHSWRRFHPGS